jgi:hypothetical protein
LTAPVTLRRVASGLIIENVRCRDMFHQSFVT